ncbi:MAG: 30S ribosomal protein S6 [Mariprofundaceae bacterium]|nr:30S ribosomal protein S6 [Mariprofundaceae bacterium]
MIPGQNIPREAPLYYETIFIVNPDVSQENTEELTDALIQRVEKAGSRIVKREYWGSRPLAYQIAKRKRGHYVLLVTDGEIKAVTALEEGLRLDERVLRMMTTRLTELSDEPSPLLRRKVREESKPAEEPAATDAAAAEAATPEAEAPAKEAEAAAPEAEAKAETEAPAKEAVAEKSKGGEAAA